MPRRSHIRVTVRTRMTRRIRIQSHLQPMERSYIAAGHVKQFTCEACGHVFEQWSVESEPTRTCPHCGEPLNV
jgi:rubrerythrin